MLKWVAAVVLCAFSSAFAVEFRVSDGVVCGGFLGFGGNISPFVYCAPNHPGELTDANLPDLEQKLTALHLHHVRIFVKPEWWDTERYRDRGQSVERLCKLFAKSNTTINLTIWGGVYDGPDVARRWAHVAAHLLNDVKLTNFTHTTLQNEPNLFNMDRDRYVSLYRSFDAYARKLNIRDKLQIVGGDLVQTDQDQWFHLSDTRLAGILDGYSAHMYANYWDPDRLYLRVREVPEIVAKLTRPKPLYLNEFGIRGHRAGNHEEPGKFEDGSPVYQTPIVGTLLAVYSIEAINRGYCAVLQWDLADVLYDRSHMYYGAIGDAKSGFALRPAYHVLKLFTDASAPGWQSFKVYGANPEVSAAAMRSKTGETSLFAVNRASTEKRVEFTNVEDGLQFRVAMWPTKPQSDALKVNNGRLSLVLPAGAVVALTTKGTQ